jgi:hypothetical protein
MIVAISVLVCLFASAIVVAYMVSRRSARPIVWQDTKPGAGIACVSGTVSDVAPLDDQVSQPNDFQPAVPVPESIVEEDGQSGSKWHSTTRRVPGSPFVDTRRFPRSDFRGSAMATIYSRNHHPREEPRRCVVVTRNLSRAGIGIATTERLLPKQLIVIEIFAKQLLCEVRWCRRRTASSYVAGCKFLKDLTADTS